MNTAVRSSGTQLGPRGVYRSYWSGTGIGSTRREGMTIRCRASRIGKGVHALELRPALQGWVLPDDGADPEPARAMTASRWYLSGTDAEHVPDEIVAAAMRAVAADAAALCDEAGLYWSAMVTAIDSDGPLVLTDPCRTLTRHATLRHCIVTDADV